MAQVWKRHLFTVTSPGPKLRSTYTVPTFLLVDYTNANLVMDGSIRVAQPIPRISVLRSGNSLTLSWSNGFSDFILQAQTNAYGVVLQSNNCSR